MSTHVPRIDQRSAKEAFGSFALEIAESTFLSSFEPNPVSGCYEDELPRVRRAILRARDGRLARFRDQVNRNAFVLGCRAYTDGKPEEHLIIGYGFRYGRTTKVESLHHAIGDVGSVRFPDAVAHAMWDYYERHEDNELLIFHNHPYSPLNLLLDNLPLASRQDRCFLAAHAFHQNQLLRRVLGQGRMTFYLGENGYVKEFNLPSMLAIFGADGQ
jgi:hypothetical protein